MTISKGRIEISANVADVLDQANRMYKRHLEFGDASPLNGMVDLKWSDVGPTIEVAISRHNEAEEFSNKAKAAYRERDLLYRDIVDILKTSRNLLKAQNNKNPARLTEWGFDVFESPKKAIPPQVANQN